MSSAHIATASDESTLQPGAVSRLANLVVDPVAAFRGIADSPSWALALLAAVVLRFGSLFVFYRPAVTPLKVVAGLLFQVGTVLPVILLAAVVTWLAAKVWRVDVGWRPSFSIVTHAYVAYTLATIAFAAAAGALLPESTDIDLRNPPFTNFAARVADSGVTAIPKLVAELDVRSVYALLVTWLGLRGAAPSSGPSAIARVVASAAIVRLAGVAAMGSFR